MPASENRNAEYPDIRKALDLPLLSPSAPYDLERMARERAASAFWWTVYPEGQCAAAIFRLWHRLGMPLQCHDADFRAVLEAED